MTLLVSLVLLALVGALVSIRLQRAHARAGFAATIARAHPTLVGAVRPEPIAMVVRFAIEVAE